MTMIKHPRASGGSNKRKQITTSLLMVSSALCIHYGWKRDLVSSIDNTEEQVHQLPQIEPTLATNTDVVIVESKIPDKSIDKKYVQSNGNALDSTIKMHSNDDKNKTNSWKIVDWSNPITKEEEEKFKCDFVKFTSTASGRNAEMCVHSFSDTVSNSIKRKGHWGDCNQLSKMWNEKAQHSDKSVYVEIGANIGSCVMEMLLGTDAKIIAFEPHPMNLFNLKMSVSKLDASFQERLRLVPIGLGQESASSTIFSATNNMGNSVIGKIIKDADRQQFDEKLQFTINVERLDSILANDITVDLMKMDAQGYECNILEGMGKDVAKGIDVIKFEWADHWLKGHNCTDLLPRMRNYGFDIYKKYVGGGSYFIDRLDDDDAKSGVYDLFAAKPNDNA